MQRRGEARRPLGRQRRRSVRRQQPLDRRALPLPLRHRIEAEREALQARLRALAGAADGLLEGAARKRQQAERRDRTEQHRADHRAGLARQRAHVEQLVRAAVALQRGQQLLLREAAVAELHLLGHRQRARVRREHRGALGGGHAHADLARRLEQFGRREQVDRARHRVEAEHRRAAAQLRIGQAADLDVVGGRAGALRHARDRGGLRRMPAGARHAVQPFRQHAAAFAAEAAHEQADDGCVHAGCSSEIRRERRPASSRSCQRGLRITSAR